MENPMDTPANEYVQRSQRMKFWQQMFLGLGGAMVFGLIGGIGKGLFDVALSSSTTMIFGIATAPVMAGIGLAALAVVGVGCIYFGSKFLAASTHLDQENQARKIGQATGLGTDVTLSAPARTVTAAPPGMGLQNLADASTEAQTAAPATQWTERFTRRDPTLAWAARSQPAQSETPVERA